MYGVDLLDFFRGDLSARRVLRLMSMLPDTSRLQAHLMAEPRTAKTSEGSAPREKWRELWGWGQDRHLQAALWDAVVGTAQRKKGTKAPTYPRPGAAQKGRSLASMMPGRAPGNSTPARPPRGSD